MDHDHPGEIPGTELDELADRARALAEDAERVECVLSNGAHALDSALALKRRLG